MLRLVIIKKKEYKFTVIALSYTYTIFINNNIQIKYRMVRVHVLFKVITLDYLHSSFKVTFRIQVVILYTLYKYTYT